MSLKRELNNLFARSPGFIQKGAVWVFSRLPHEYRYGKGYAYIEKLLESTSKFDRSQIQKFQFDRFLSIYKHALNNIPFYKKWYGQYGLNKNSIKSPEDISKIPTLTKDIVRKNLKDMLWPSFPKKWMTLSRTGGTTGQPVKFYMAKYNYQMHRAFIYNVWKRNGYEPFDFKIILGRSEYFTHRSGIRQFFYPRDNFLCLALYDIDKEVIKKYIEIIKKEQPKFFLGFPGTIFIFAQIVRELKSTLPKLKGVFLYAQKLLAGQREVIEGVFGCRVFTHYGMAERIILAAECEYSKDYHIVPEYGLTELIDNDGKVINAPNVVGELVGTSFYNKVMPLIRYRTADLAAYRESQTCPCGRPHRILSGLKGRTQDFLVLSDGTLRGTAPGAPIFFIFSEYCRGFQFVQEVPGKVEIRVVPRGDNPPDYIEILRKELKDKYFGPMEFEIIETSDLIKSASGKPKFLIQKLKTPRNHEESVTYLVEE